MKRLSLLLLTVFTATFLVACSDDDSGGAPAPVTPSATPPPAVGTTDDGFITWYSEEWNNNITNAERLAGLLTLGSAPYATVSCGTDGYYPATGHRYFYGNQDCEYYSSRAGVVFRYNPTTNKARLYVYGLGQNGLIAGFSRETTPSNQATGFFADFGPIHANGYAPDHISSYRVYISSPATSHTVSSLSIEVRFGPAPTGDVVFTDNLKRK